MHGSVLQSFILYAYSTEPCPHKHKKRRRKKEEKKVITWASSDTDTSGGDIIKPAATRQCLKVLRIKTVTVKGAATPPAILGTRHTVSTNGHARQSIIICSVRSRSLRGSPLDLQIRSNWASTPPSVDKPCSLISHEKSPVQFSSVRDGIYMRLEKPICAPPRLSEVLYLKQLQYSFLTDDGLFFVSFVENLSSASSFCASVLCL